MHDSDNVAIVANDRGLEAGTVLAPAAGSLTSTGLRLLDRVPQGHKVALVDCTTRCCCSTRHR